MIEYPKINEFAVCKVNKITNYGVFVELLEYDNIEGFIHISQVSSTWIKNIHNHVKPNQVRVAKVLSVDESKHHVDLSFNRVSNADEKRKISDYRLFKRSQSLLQIIAKELNISDDVAWEEIAEPILSVDDSLYSGFVNILKYGVEICPKLKTKYVSKLKEVLSKNITIKDKFITGVIETNSDKENGCKIIKNNLEKSIKEHSNAKIKYIGPGKYELVVSAIDYKNAIKDFKKISELITKNLKGCNLNIIKSDKKK
jgi:translation initiation factor 2 subunit 1